MTHLALVTLCVTFLATAYGTMASTQDSVVAFGVSCGIICLMVFVYFAYLVLNCVMY